MTQKDDDLLSSLNFVQNSDLKRQKGDRMEKVRTNFIKALTKQKGFAQKHIDNPAREVPKDEKQIFERVGEQYVVEPRYGRRKVVIKKDASIVVRDLPAVITVIDKLIESVRNKVPSIESALADAATARPSDAATGNKAPKTPA